MQFVQGFFIDKLPRILNSTEGAYLAFIDGDHNGKRMLEYFEIFCNFSSKNVILVFDDIHWSRDMQKAWKTICKDTRVTLSINLFFLGIVFFHSKYAKKELKYMM